MKWIHSILLTIFLFKVGYTACAAEIGPGIREKRPGRTVEPSAAVAPGSRVRVQAPSVLDFRGVGILVAMDADTLIVKPEYGTVPWKIPFDAVTTFEWSQGLRSSMKKGAAIGFCAGGTVGMIGLYSIMSQYSDNGGTHIDEGVIIGFLGGGIPGAALGAYLGSRIVRERWRPILLPVRIGILQHPPGGLALTISCAF